MKRLIEELLSRIRGSKSPSELASHVMDHVPEIGRGSLAGMLLFKQDGALTVVEMRAPERTAAARYLEYGQAHDDVLRSVVEHGSPTHDLEIRDEQAWKKHPMYIHFGRPVGVKHYGVAPIVIDGSVRGVIACARQEGAEALGPSDLLLLSTVSMFAQDRLAQLVRNGGVNDFAALTRQQLRICAGVAQCRTNPEIARELSIGVNGIRWHLKRIFQHVGVSSRDELRVRFLFWYPSGGAL